MATAAMGPAKDEYLLVAAIDFGTTYSGYAYSFVPDKKKKIDESIKLNRPWQVMEYQVSY